MHDKKQLEKHKTIQNNFKRTLGDRDKNRKQKSLNVKKQEKFQAKYPWPNIFGNFTIKPIIMPKRSKKSNLIMDKNTYKKAHMAIKDEWYCH